MPVNAPSHYTNALVYARARNNCVKLQNKTKCTFKIAKSRSSASHKDQSLGKECLNHRSDHHFLERLVSCVVWYVILKQAFRPRRYGASFGINASNAASCGADFSHSKSTSFSPWPFYSAKNGLRKDFISWRKQQATQKRRFVYVR